MCCNRASLLAEYKYIPIQDLLGYSNGYLVWKAALKNVIKWVDHLNICILCVSVSV